jgi:hypothetical protein
MRRRSAVIERLTLTEFGVHWLATAQARKPEGPAAELAVLSAVLTG